jgi:cytoskeletal protein RodZ
MRRLALLAVFSLVAGLIFVPVAVAQEDPTPEVEELQAQPEVIETPVEEAAEEPIEEAAGIDVAEPAPEEAIEEAAQEAVAEEAPVGEAVAEATVPTPQGGVAVQEAEVIVTVPEGTAPLPVSGGPGITGPAAILPAAAALLLGSGILAYAVLRRRR